MAKTKKKKIIESPPWGMNIKLVVSLTFVFVVGALMVRFQEIVSPLIITFMIIYIFHPVVSLSVDKLKIPWKLSVNLLYLFAIILLLTIVSATGFALVGQLQNLVNTIEGLVNNMPEFLVDLEAGQVSFEIFDYQVNISDYVNQSNFDIVSLGEQLLGFLQSALGQVGGLVASMASTAITTIGWGAFVFTISYFILIDIGRNPNFMGGIELPGHMEDIRRLGHELNRIWNAFFRGQIAIFLMVALSVFLLLTFLGVENALGLALLAGLGKFVPYIGPFSAGLTTALVALFQEKIFFGLEPFMYALVVIVSMIILDQIFDNMVIPRLLGESLGVHPAAVLVAAIMAAKLIGIIGLLLAAPVLASIQLIVGFAMRKMVDLPPWPEPKEGHIDIDYPFEKTFRKFVIFTKTRIEKGRKRNG